MAEIACEREVLKDNLVKDYADKIFYFSLKKSGNAQEAEDLASDILLNAIAALDKGTVPEHFSAWVWRIARNRYSVWADKKHKRSAMMSGDSIEDCKIEDRTVSPEETVIHNAELQLLRRELAFISSDYRNVLVAYYIQGRKVSDIAMSLGFPEGTVTSKLDRARKKLKEGMIMAREFGKRSYDPETIFFSTSGSQPVGLPWAAIRRKIPVNILCEAHNNPCTLQELALELGIAVPYMEEEAELLVKAELLKKLDNGKYLTGFFIVPKECQNEINEIVCDFTEHYASAYWNLAEKALKKAAELGVTTGEYSENDAQMYFAFYLEQLMQNSVFSSNLYTKFKRADGGNWGIAGFERGADCRLPSSFFNNSVNDWETTHWNGYQAADPGDPVFGKRRYHEDVPNRNLNITLRDIAEGSEPASFSEAEKENLKKLIEDGFCVRRNDGTVCVNALVFRGDMNVRLDEYLKTLPEYTSTLKEMRHLIETAKEITARYSNQYLRDDFEYYVAMAVIYLRSTLSRLWKDNGLYTGESAQFCAFHC